MRAALLVHTLKISALFLRLLARLLIAIQISPAVFAQDDNAEALLAEADRLAWLKNWQRAETLFAKAEQMFKERGDRRNELYAHIGRLRGQLPTMANAEVSATLADLLTEPLANALRHLRWLQQIEHAAQWTIDS